MGTSCRLVLLGLCVWALTALGCRPPNLPESVRWWLFSNFGAEQICPELLKRSVPLRLSETQPAIGRFFPTQCTYSVNDDARTMTVHLNGTGYGFMAPARRVTFNLSTSVEYRPDFWFAEDAMYVWGKLNRIAQGPDFQLGYVENPVIDVAAGVPPFGSLATFLGNSIVQSKITQGFTVVRDLDTDSDSFALGILNPPQTPVGPFDVSDSEFLTYANETIEVHPEQRDYLGPFEVVDDDQWLHVQASVVGPSVEIMAVDRFTGDLWRDAYLAGQTGPPSGMVRDGAAIEANLPLQKKFRLPPGQYYLVVDNTSSAGVVQPPVQSINPFFSTAARISYLVQLRED